MYVDVNVHAVLMYGTSRREWSHKVAAEGNQSRGCPLCVCACREDGEAPSVSAEKSPCWWILCKKEVSMKTPLRGFFFRAT